MAVSVVNGEREQIFDFRGLSTDEKPNNQYVGNGSTFLEIDTGKVFLYDAEHKVWKEI